MATHLFSPITLSKVELSNRIVVSPMCQYMANDGSANDWHLMHYGQLSMGAGALLIFEATHVAPEGRISHHCLGLYSDENEIALKRVVQFCRSFGVAKLGVQLAHAGRKGSAHTPIEGGKPLAANENPWTTLGPSALPFAPGWPAPQAMSANDLDNVKRQFVEAAVRAAHIGFDVVELHAGHGYLLHEFVSPISNQRNDEYGGSLENRMRFPLEVFEAVRAALPAAMSCGARITGCDWINGGITADEMVAFARELKTRGCDFVDVTSGQIDPRQKIPFAPGYNVEFARQAKNLAGITAMSVGMITRVQQAERIIADGDADMVALARGAMDNPRWVWHAARELGIETTYPKNYQRCHPTVWQR